eukprot:5423341-Amphidinium_carterae.1
MAYDIPGSLSLSAVHHCSESESRCEAKRFSLPCERTAARVPRFKSCIGRRCKVSPNSWRCIDGRCLRGHQYRHVALD